MVGRAERRRRKKHYPIYTHKGVRYLRKPPCNFRYRCGYDTDTRGTCFPDQGLCLLEVLQNE